MFEKLKDKTVRRIEIGIAIYLVVSVILDQLANQTPFNVLWFCSMSGLILAYGSLTKSKIIPSSILTMALVVQVPWILDFFLEMFGLGLGRSSFLLNYGWGIFLTSTNLHAVLIPFALFLVLKRGYVKRSIIFSFFYTVMILVVPFLLTGPVENINCVFASCDVEIHESQPLMTYLPFFLVGSLLYRVVTISALHLVIIVAIFLYNRYKKKKPYKEKQS